MNPKHGRTVVVALAFAGALGLQAACGGGDRDAANMDQPAADAQSQAAHDGSTPIGVTPDPSAERQVITLTGCLQRGVTPSEFTLVSVGTGGITEPAAPRRQEGAAESNPTPESRADLMAATSYRVVATGDEDLSQYAGQRVTVSGRLAAKAPAAAPRQGEEAGREVESDTTSSTVAGTPSDLRGFYVSSVRKVADTCAAD
jgi:hypothetical protein